MRLPAGIGVGEKPHAAAPSLGSPSADIGEGAQGLGPLSEPAAKLLGQIDDDVRPFEIAATLSDGGPHEVQKGEVLEKCNQIGERLIEGRYILMTWDEELRPEPV